MATNINVNVNLSTEKARLFVSLIILNICDSSDYRIKTPMYDKNRTGAGKNFCFRCNKHFIKIYKIQEDSFILHTIYNNSNTIMKIILADSG